MKVFALQLNGPDGIDEVFFVAANNRQEVIETLLAEEGRNRHDSWRIQKCSDVLLLEGAYYDTDVPCKIKDRLCTDDGGII